MSCLTPSAFDADAFGIPFYRVSTLDLSQLPAEITGIGPGPFAVDAKAPAADVAAAHGLSQCGFRKVCMQLTLEHHLEILLTPDEDVHIHDRLEVPDEIIEQHAANFVYDRFSLEPLLPEKGRKKLYAHWLKNSLSGTKFVAHDGFSSLCTFSFKADICWIDLVSILEHRRGFGAKVVGAVLAFAQRSQMRSVRVTTECENAPAWKLYQKLGFTPLSYTAAFHLVRQ